MARYKYTQESGIDFKVNTTDKCDSYEDSNEVRQILDDLGELLGHSKFNDLYPKDATSGGDIDIRRITTKSAVATLTTGEAGFVKVSAAAGYSLTLPTAVGNKLTYIFVKTDANTNLITIDGAGTETINGSLTYTDLNYQYAYVAIRSDNANWFILFRSTNNIAITTGKLSQFAPTTSAELAGVISDETGTLKLVFSDSPVITTQITAPRIIQTNAIENTSKLLQTEDIFSDYVVTGLLPATSANLISDISAGHAYVTGVRVNKSATSKTYTASVDTYVDVNSVGTYTFPEVALGAAAPAITADSIRLAKVVTGATAITGVTDLRKLTLTLPAPTVVLTGGQIAFPAAQAPSANANTLDDYEEGTWTMGVSFGGLTTGITYGVGTGFYTKIGNTVAISGYCVLTSKGTDVGTAYITGLPFVIANNNAGYFSPSLRLLNITFANQFQAFGVINTTTIMLQEITEAGVVSVLTNADFANDSTLIIGATYRIN